MDAMKIPPFDHATKRDESGRWQVLPPMALARMLEGRGRRSFTIPPRFVAATLLAASAGLVVLAITLFL